MNKNLYSALAHHLYNRDIPVQVLHRKHDAFDPDLDYHSHDFMELVLVTDGSATHSVNLPNHDQFNYRIEKGHIFLLNIGDIHTFLFEKNEKLTVENIIFDPTVLSRLDIKAESEKKFLDFIYMLPQLPPEIRFSKERILNKKQFKQINTLFEMIQSEQNNNLVGNSTIRILILNTLLLFMSRFSLYKLDERSEYIKPGSANMLSLLGYIQQHYCEDINLEHLAELFHYSVRHLTRKFKEITGETVSSYIRHLRINKATNMLLHTDLKISEIASQVGISNSSFFCKIFKETTGITPVEYRLENQKFNILSKDSQVDDSLISTLHEQKIFSPKKK